MSASREKKVRQEQESTGYTDPKTAKEAKERKEEKRSSTIYLLVAIAFVVVGIISLVWKSGITERNVTAVTIDGENYTAAETQYYYINNYQSFVSNYYYYLSYFGLDTSKSLKEQGIFDLYPPEKERCYVKAPVFSFAKLHGLDAYLSPEMKSTGEAIGYDKKLSRAMYKALQASGMNVQNYGTVFVTLADEDKPEGLPLVRRFYEMGFNIEATAGTAAYLKSFGIRTRVRGKISDGSHEILDSIRSGYVSYIINTRSIHSSVHAQDGAAIRRCAVENGVTVFTSLDTVRVLLDVLEETTLAVSTIHAE